MAKDDLEVQIPDPTEEMGKRFDRLFYLIIGAILIGFISLLFMVAGLVIEAWRFNSTIYRENQSSEVNKRIYDDQRLIIDAIEKLNQDIREMKRRQKQDVPVPRNGIKKNNN